MNDNFRQVLLRFFKERCDYRDMVRSSFAKQVLDCADNYEYKKVREHQNPIDAAGCWSGTSEGHRFWQSAATKLCMFMLQYQKEYNIDKYWLKNMTSKFKRSFYSEYNVSDFRKMEELYKEMFNSDVEIEY